MMALALGAGSRRSVQQGMDQKVYIPMNVDRFGDRRFSHSITNCKSGRSVAARVAAELPEVVSEFRCFAFVKRWIIKAYQKAHRPR